jgi:endonuclease VIII
VPEGDALHRAARRLEVLVGERVAVETPHPRAAVKGLADRLDGRVLESVEAVGKNLLLRFEGGVVLRSHLRMKGRWRVQQRGGPVFGRPWLVLRGSHYEALQFNGPVLELGSDVWRRLGPDVLAPEPDFTDMLRRVRADDPAQPLGEALLRQRLVAGVGNMWMAEALWHARLSPWASVGSLSDEELLRALQQASGLMERSLEGVRSGGAVYRRAGRGCRRCGTPIRSYGLGEANRTAYWCPACQPTAAGTEPPVA